MLGVTIRDDDFVGVDPAFILKVDGHRPLLYPLDYINTNIHFLQPVEGFVLSLLDGHRRLADARRLFASALGDGGEAPSFDEILSEVDERVRSQPSQTGLGADGIIQHSPNPLANCARHDPREFVVSPAAYRARLSDPRTRIRLEVPVNLYTVFTHRCFTRCLYCYAERPRVDEMSLARWRELIEEARGLGIRLCSPDNGDTFARRDGVAFLECLLDNDMHFLLSTKAHMTREMIDRLMEGGFAEKVNGVIQRQVQLSVDAVDPHVARRILNVRNPRTPAARETAENWLSVGVMPKIKAVITGLNYHQAKPIVDYFYPIGARVFHFVRYARSFHRHTDDLFVEPHHVPVLERQFDEIRAQYPDVEIVENLSGGGMGSFSPTLDRRREMWDNRLGCGGGWFALGISADGKAFLCEQMTMDDEYIVGDARHQSITEIWNGEPMTDFIFPTREQFSGSACNACDEFEQCMWEKGRCYRNAFFSYGTIYDQPPLCPKNSRPGLRIS